MPFKVTRVNHEDDKSDLGQTYPKYQYMYSYFLNSFAANFLTILFYQCHIYFNCKGHSGKSGL